MTVIETAVLDGAARETELLTPLARLNSASRTAFLFFLLADSAGPALLRAVRTVMAIFARLAWIGPVAVCEVQIRRHAAQRDCRT
jgi:hypothetical protein